MMQVKSRRGRPKGTGIDDSDRIARLAEMLRVRPELKPTTAIRIMGFADPSAIRRLRDKYKHFAESLDRLPADDGKAVASPRPARAGDAKPAALTIRT